MKITINTSNDISIDWNARGSERVIQNVLNLLSLVRYEVAFNRTLGLPPELTDRPATQLVQEYQAEIVELIEENEPRAAVESLTFLGLLENGQIIIEVVMEIVA